jgi:hypothetical protein
MKSKRTPVRKKAKEIAKLLRAERPDYAYLKRVFQCLRQELDVQVTRGLKSCLTCLPNSKSSGITRLYGNLSGSRTW